MSKMALDDLWQGYQQKRQWFLQTIHHSKTKNANAQLTVDQWSREFRHAQKLYTYRAPEYETFWRLSSSKLWFDMVVSAKYYVVARDHGMDDLVLWKLTNG